MFGPMKSQVLFKICFSRWWVDSKCCVMTWPCSLQPSPVSPGWAPDALNSQKKY